MYLHKCVGVYCIHESFQLTVHILDSKTLYSLTLVHLIPSWLVCSETECTVHVALPKWPMNQFKPVQQSIQQALRADCPNIHIYCSPIRDCNWIVLSATYTLIYEKSYFCY